MNQYIELRKDYYFSYEKIRQKIRDGRRFYGIEKYEGVTELDMLARLFHKEEIGIDAYGEVEWRAFGITADNIEKFANSIELPDEIVRVLRYISDHSRDVLPLEATKEEIDTFELACDSLIRKIIDNHPLLRFNAANMNLLGESSEIGDGDMIIYKHLWKPSDYQYTNLYPFRAILTAAGIEFRAVNLLFDKPLEKEEEKDEMSVIDKIVPSIKSCLEILTNRPVREHKEPIIQTLFSMSVLAKAAAAKGAPNSPSLFNFSNMLIDYIKKKYEIDVSIPVREAALDFRDYLISTDEDLSKKQQELEKSLGEIEFINKDENIIDDNITPSDKPDSSFFAISDKRTYKDCEKQLIEDINASTSKLSACRNIRRSTAAGFFRLEGVTNDQKANLINPWVKYTSQKYVFTGDDFRKAPNVKRKQ